MKLCLNCGGQFVGDCWKCPSCEHVPAVNDGFLSFAPRATAGEGFDDCLFCKLVEVEASNFWFRARNKIIIWALANFFADAKRFLEIGCGNGFVLNGIASAFPSLALWGSEISCTGLAFAAKRVQRAKFFQMDARAIPYVEEFDVVGAFDVIEHIEQDEQVLEQIHRALVSRGGMILTVPQHPFLWSIQDEAACHVRRYRREELKKKVERAGFQVEMTTSFVSIVLPLMILSRLRRRTKLSEFDPTAELRLGRFVNMALECAMNIERLFVQCGFRFPAGGSLLLVARKP